MGKMIERATEALCSDYADLSADAQLFWRNQARAVLAAIREPAPEMINAYCRLEEAEGVEGLISADAWQAMIDAALSEDG